MYSTVIDAGEKLRSVSDPETSAVLQEKLSQLQQSWGDTQVELENMTLQLANTLQLNIPDPEPATYRTLENVLR